MHSQFERTRDRSPKVTRISSAMTPARLHLLALTVDSAPPHQHAIALRAFTNASLAFADEATSRRVWLELAGGAA